jgi:hypothetical protein
VERQTRPSGGEPPGEGTTQEPSHAPPAEAGSQVGCQFGASTAEPHAGCRELIATRGAGQAGARFIVSPKGTAVEKAIADRWAHGYPVRSEDHYPWG